MGIDEGVETGRTHTRNKVSKQYSYMTIVI